MSSESIQIAYKNFLESDPPYCRRQFVEECFQRIPFGQEKEALEGIFFVPDFSFYDIWGIYETIPQNWTSRNHIRKKLASITERICKTHFNKIRKSPYYQVLPYETIEKISDVTTAQIDTWVLEAIAEVPLNLSSSRLFSLVGLIAPKLAQQQATVVLSYGLDLLEEDMTEKDGDGIWSLSLQPPETVEASIAGYIWASLASPNTAERWQAAHVVCLLCAFEEHDILAQLQSFALGCQQLGPFHASGLPIYELSAKLWLLFALQRAVKLGSAKSVLHFEEFIRTTCSPIERHLMLRGTGAKILLELESKKAIELGIKELKRLQLINVSEFEVLESNPYRRELEVVTPSTGNNDDEFFFGYDISDYWFESLGRVFGFATAEVERRALRIVRDDFGVPGIGGWRIDPRHHRDLYGEFETQHSHGMYPKVEDLAFYHAYHSMMIVAGELIDTEQRHQGKDYPDEFEEWIARHSLTRSDSLWLADRRDPDPLEIPRWKSEKVSDIWRFSISKNDLLEQIWLGDGDICVWGSWNNTDYNREESINVFSALVNSDHAQSLVRALQTASSPHNYRIPLSGDELEIDSNQYQLKGWVCNTSKENRIDERDPWAGDIRYPPLCPAQWFVQVNDLQPDYERRIWRSPTFGELPVFISHVWGRKSESFEHFVPESGSQLFVNKATLLDWLSLINMDLIFEVQMGRKFNQDRYGRNDEDNLVYLLPYTLVFLFRSNGKIETI